MKECYLLLSSTIIQGGGRDERRQKNATVTSTSVVIVLACETVVSKVCWVNNGGPCHQRRYHQGRGALYCDVTSSDKEIICRHE